MCPSRYVPSPEIRVVISLLDVGAKIVCDKYYDLATHVASEFLDAHIRARYLTNHGATFSMGPLQKARNYNPSVQIAAIKQPRPSRHGNGDDGSSLRPDRL